MNSLSYLHSTLNQINDTGVVHSTVVDPRRLYAHQSVTHTHYLPAVVHKENCIPGHHYYKLPRYAVISQEKQTWVLVRNLPTVGLPCIDQMKTAVVAVSQECLMPHSLL